MQRRAALAIHAPRTPFIHSTTGGLFQRRVGYVERAGYGVDMMYEELLRLGKEPPWFIPDELTRG